MEPSAASARRAPSAVSGMQSTSPDPAFIRLLLSLNCELFENLTEKELSGFLSTGGVSILQAGENQILRQQGEEQHDFGVIITGRAEIRQYDDPASVFTVDVLEPGELFGEIIAFAPHPKWSAGVVATEPCEVLFLPIHFLTSLPDSERSGGSQIALNLIRVIAGKAMTLKARIEVLTRSAMRARIAVFLLQQARNHGRSTFSIPLNRESMARYLNVSRPSMSRELSRMKDAGLIDFYKNSFTILDMSALTREI